MKPSEYQKLAARTESPADQALTRMMIDSSPDSLQAMRLMHAVMGMLTEAGELGDALKKHIFYHRPLDVVNVEEEIGDLLWYVALACNALDVDMGRVMQANIDKLRVRFPEKYTDAQAHAENRDLAAERQALEDRHAN